MAPRRSILVSSLFATGCALTASSWSALAAEPTIALVQINQQALFFTQMNEGAEKKAKELGAKLVIFNANNDPAAQNNAIETYIAEKVDGLVVVAIDINGIMPAVEAAAAAGIPVVAVDAILPAGPQMAQVGVDNEAAGKLIGEHFVKVTTSWAARPSSARRCAELVHPERPPEGLRGRRQGGPGRHHGRRRRRAQHPGQRDGGGREPDDRQPRPDRDLRHRRAGAAGCRGGGREPGPPGRRQDRRLGSHRLGDQGHRRRLRRRRRPAGSRPAWVPPPSMRCQGDHRAARARRRPSPCRSPSSPRTTSSPTAPSSSNGRQ